MAHNIKHMVENMYEQKFMDMVIGLSRRAASLPGTQPFGAIVVRDGVVVSEGLNHELAKHDPTSHGEIEAIRDACRRLGTNDLSDCIMYSIGEPCPMCTVAIRLAKISKVFYGASHKDAFDAYNRLSETSYADIGVEGLRVEASNPVESRSTPYSCHEREACAAVYWEWAEHMEKQLELAPDGGKYAAHPTD